jgi:hypothetical protein
MVFNVSIVACIHLTSCCKFWIDLLHVARVYSKTASFFNCTTIWIPCFNFRIFTSYSLTIYFRLLLSWSNFTNLDSNSFVCFLKAQYLCSFYSWSCLSKSLSTFILFMDYSFCFKLPFLWPIKNNSIWTLLYYSSLDFKVFLDWTSWTKTMCLSDFASCTTTLSLLCSSSFSSSYQMCSSWNLKTSVIIYSIFLLQYAKVGTFQ